MSFGFSVGDFITVIELANKIRKEFVAAPSQFKAISDEYVALTTFRAILTPLLEQGQKPLDRPPRYRSRPLRSRTPQRTRGRAKADRKWLQEYS